MASVSTFVKTKKIFKMKITIEDYRFTYSVDYDKLNVVDTEKGTVEEYQPSVKELIQNFLSLLEILYSSEEIKSAMSEVVDW